MSWQRQNPWRWSWVYYLFAILGLGAVKIERVNLKMYSPTREKSTGKKPRNIENGDRNLNVESISIICRQESNGPWQGVE